MIRKLHDKRWSVSLLVATLIFGVIPITASAAGRTATTVINTLLNGKGVPAASLGINGDFYIDKTAMNLYGPKALGKWPLPVSMRGAVGPMGPVGVDGKVGEKGTSSPSLAGAVGSKGETGATGATGATGSAGAPGASGAGGAGPIGATGATGSAGTIGATGATGATGSAGTAGTTGATGATGATGSAGTSGANGSAGFSGTNGTNGIPGANGEKGAQGNTGATGGIGNTGEAGAAGAQGNQGVIGEPGIAGPPGAIGPSEVVVFSIVGPAGIDPWTFSSSGGSTESISSDFGNLHANKSYKFTIVLTGYVNITGWNGLAVGSSLRYTGGVASVNSTVAYSQGKVLLPGPLKKYEFTYLYEGTIVTGPDGNNLNVSVIDGENWSNGFFNNGLKILGTAYIQLIGGALPNWSG